jgi:hypothetical protein
MFLTPKDCMMLCCNSNVQQNSINPTHLGTDRCRIIEYSRLSDETYTDIRYYR